MTKNTYNGWTNYETWAVALWLDNDKVSYSYWKDQALEHSLAAPTCRQVEQGIWKPEQAAKFNLADQLKDEVHDAAPLSDASLYTDLLNAALSEVNWQEIADRYLEEIPQPEPAESEATEPPVIFRYTRAQAIEDGVLVDVSSTAQEAGIKYPTAMSAAVWETYVTVPRAVSWQDESGRLWDILHMLRHAVQCNKDAHEEIMFTVLVQNDRLPAQAVKLKAVCGPGDDAAPVITVMLPQED